MAVSRADGRRERTPRLVEPLGLELAPVALDLLELSELAWHDVYGDITPPADVIDDILECSRGSIAGLVDGALLAVTDSRDLKVVASEIRERRT